MNFVLESRPADCSDSLVLTPLLPAVAVSGRRRPRESSVLFSHASGCCHFNTFVPCPGSQNEAELVNRVCLFLQSVSENYYPPLQAWWCYSLRMASFSW